MSENSMWKREQATLDQRKGLTGRGIVGCLSFLISGAAAYALFLYFDQHYNLARIFDVPRDWPDWVIPVVGVLVLFVAVQATFTIILSVFWRLAGKDKKVGDKMDDLMAKWDDVDYGM